MGWRGRSSGDGPHLPQELTLNIVEDIRSAKGCLRPKGSLLQAQRLDRVANGKRARVAREPHMREETAADACFRCPLRGIKGDTRERDNCRSVFMPPSAGPSPR